MKQRLVTSIAVLALLAVASTASAQGLNLKVRGEASTTPAKSRVELQAEMEARKASSSERRAEVKTNIEERKASSTAKRIEMQQSIAKRMAEHAEKMLGAMIERLEKLARRIESRIEKIKAEGGVVVESERFLADAKVHLGEAKTSLNLYSAIDLSADTLRENFTKLRELALQVKVHLRQAHTALVNATKALKPGLRVNAGATTTTSVSQ